MKEKAFALKGALLLFGLLRRPDNLLPTDMGNPCGTYTVDIFTTSCQTTSCGTHPARNRQRKKRGGFPLKPLSAHCTGEYTEPNKRMDEAAWERVASIIDETRNLGVAWPTLDEAGRKVLLDY